MEASARSRSSRSRIAPGADLALTEVVVELVRVLAKIEHDWDGEPEDMIDARAILSRITLGDDHG